MLVPESVSRYVVVSKPYVDCFVLFEEEHIRTPRSSPGKTYT